MLENISEAAKRGRKVEKLPLPCAHHIIV